MKSKRLLHTDIYGNREFVGYLRNEGKFLDSGENRERDLILIDYEDIDRPEADKLLTAMKSWVGQRRDEPDGVEANALDAFAGWVNEREEIAGQTAAVSQTRPRDW